MIINFHFVIKLLLFKWQQTIHSQYSRGHTSYIHIKYPFSILYDNIPVIICFNAQNKIFN